MPKTFSATIYNVNLRGTHQAHFRRDLVMAVEERMTVMYSSDGKKSGEEPSGCLIHLITGKSYWSTESCADVVAKWQGTIPPHAATPCMCEDTEADSILVPHDVGRRWVCDKCSKVWIATLCKDGMMRWRTNEPTKE